MTNKPNQAISRLIRVIAAVAPLAERIRALRAWRAANVRRAEKGKERKGKEAKGSEMNLSKLREIVDEIYRQYGDMPVEIETRCESFGLEDAKCISTEFRDKYVFIVSTERFDQ